MKHLPAIFRLAFAVGLSIAALSLAGCAFERAITKAKPTAFLESTGTANSGKMARLPFERSWRTPSLRPSKYSRIVLRPVTTAYLRTDKWEQSISPFIPNKQVFAQRAAELGRVWDASLNRAFTSPKNQLTVVGDATQPGTLVVEIAITEVVFGHPLANAASYAFTAGGIAFAGLFTPSVAFEARVKDGATGQLIATASDRRSTKIKVIDFSELTYTQSNRQICDEWSRELMEAFNRDLYPKVRRSWFSVF